MFLGFPLSRNSEGSRLSSSGIVDYNAREDQGVGNHVLL
jgi:hypothetical protein